MAYVERSEFVDLQIPSAALSGISDDQVDNALANASDLADSYIAKRHGLPLTDWGADLKRAVGSIAAFDLISFRGFRPDSGNDAIIVKRYEDAIKWLEKVAEGKVEMLGVVDSTPAVDEGAPISDVSEYEPFRFNTSRPDDSICCDDDGL